MELVDAARQQNIAHHDQIVMAVRLDPAQSLQNGMSLRVRCDACCIDFLL
jgi:hypothetical protein